MESDDTFGMYLRSRGVDMFELHKRYTAMMKEKPEFIMTFYEREFPEEFIAWKAKKRVLGDDTTN